MLFYLVGMVVCFIIFMLMELADCKTDGRRSNHQDVIQLVMASVFWPIALMYLAGMYAVEWTMKNG